MNQESLKDLNAKFNTIMESVQANYKHDDATYRQAQNIINFIINSSNIEAEYPEESVLMLGKTGWGKSTSINYLSSVPLVVDENSHLKPKSAKDSISEIGGGFSSTTLFPVACRTPFGHAYDMPGDEQTRGTVVEMINCICKKNIAKSLKRIKIVLVIPASTMTSAGSYGKGFKDILQANSKFLGGINAYKKSVMFLITFCQRYPKMPSLITEGIRKCLQHEDGALLEYKELIDYVIENQQVMFFAKPSEDAQTNSEYTIPNSPQWKNYQSQKIVEAINKLPATECNGKKFSVPFNAQMVLALKKIMTVYTEKIKTDFFNKFTTIQISGIELETLNKYLVDLRTKSITNLLNFERLFAKNAFLDCPKLESMNEVVKFIYQFIKDEKQQEPEYIENWLTVELDHKITQVIEQVQVVLAAAGSNFKKDEMKLGLTVKPYLQNYTNVASKMNQLVNLYEGKLLIETKKNDENSEFYEEYTEKVYDKTIQQPYEVEQKYTVQESRTTKVNTPISYTESVPVSKSRLAYRDQTQYYTESVAKTRTVTKYRTQTVTHTGGRRYGLFGPKERWTSTHQVPYQVQEVYYEQEQRTRQVSKPYTQHYTEYVTETKVRYEMKDKTEQVPVEKTRMKTLYKDKQIFKDVKKKRLNQQKYDSSYNQINVNIAAKENQVDQELNTSYQCQLGYKISQVQKPNSDKVYNENHRKLLRKWLEREHFAFVKSQPKRSLCRDANGEAI